MAGRPPEVPRLCGVRGFVTYPARIRAHTVSAWGEWKINHDKLCSLKDAIATFVKDGASVVLGAALENAIPFAATYELIRQGRCGLNVIAPISDISTDMLIGAGCVAEVTGAWVGNVSGGMGHNYRRAAESGETVSAEVEASGERVETDGKEAAMVNEGAPAFGESFAPEIAESANEDAAENSAPLTFETTAEAPASEDGDNVAEARRPSQDDEDAEEEDAREVVDMGAVDGPTGEQRYYVDGFTTEENGELLARLHRVVEGTA